MSIREFLVSGSMCTVMLRISARALIQFSNLEVGAFSRVGAYSRQRFGKNNSIILCLGWALIRELRLFEALRNGVALNV